MNIVREKEILYTMLENITRERNDLLQLQFDIMRKLDRLDNLEKKETVQPQNAIQAPPIDFEVEVKNDVEETIEVPEYIEETIEEVTEEKTAHDVMSEKPIHEIIEEHNRKLGIVEEEEVEKSIIPKVEIEREKDRIGYKRASSLNLERVNGLIINILKDNGRPLHIKDIFSELNERLESNSEKAIKMANLRNNILPRIVKNNNRVSRVTRGFYQFEL